MPKPTLLDHYRYWRAHARLLDDLGPFTPEQPIRTGVSQMPFDGATVGRPDVSAQIFSPLDIPSRGAVFLIPGLHFAGPDDVRLRRFCRALARAGMFVFAPYLPTYAALRTEPSVIDEAKAAFDAFSRSPHRPLAFKPLVFSVSFGSLPAFALAASTDFAPHIGGVVTFGGFASFENAMTFCLGAHGENSGIARDPLNLPVIFLNLRAQLDAPRDVIESACDGWQTYIRRTWGRPEFKVRTRYAREARDVATTLAPRARELFLAGCGVTPDALALAHDALSRMAPRTDLDPAPYIADLNVPVSAFHGRDDDVIPHTELDVLASLMPLSADFHPYTTGLFDHTRKAGLGGAPMGAALAEARTMLAMLNTLVRFSGRRFGA